MTRRTAAAVTVLTIALGPLAACGETVDLRDTAPTTDDADAASDVADAVTTIADDAGLEAVLAAMLADWRGLGEQVVAGDPHPTLARIDAAWAGIEPVIRTEHSDSYSGFQQAIDLARTSVERRRPADANKGYLVAVDLTDEILAR